MGKPAVFDIDAFIDEQLFSMPADRDPVEFLETELYIPETGKAIELHPEQRAVIRAMLAKGADGKFLYSTMVYSSIKKSAKTTIGGGLALWQALRVPNGRVYIVGNDLQQADNRMMEAIRYCCRTNPRLAARTKIIKNSIHIDNGTQILAVAVDAAGEAGSNPTGIFWTEAWGAKLKKHEEMWSEMALSPTRQGDSFKFVESYAGHSGESNILERLYLSGVHDGKKLDPEISPELFVNGRLIVYWNTRKYLPWQQDNPEYYAQEQREKTPEEYARQHENKWASASSPFIPIEWWDACKGELPPLRRDQPVVVGIDGASTNDCFAIVVVSRTGERLELRESRVWVPDGTPIDFREPENYIRDLAQRYSVVAWAFDQTHLRDMTQRLGREGLGYFEEFNQNKPRAVADKHLFDIIRDRRIVHDGTQFEVRQHLLNASRRAENSSTQDVLRIVKRNERAKIDLAVAASMACERAAFYNIGD